MNISLIVMEWKYGAIDADDYSCHGYYIIKISSSPYMKTGYRAQNSNKDVNNTVIRIHL